MLTIHMRAVDEDPRCLVSYRTAVSSFLRDTTVRSMRRTHQRSVCRHNSASLTRSGANRVGTRTIEVESDRCEVRIERCILPSIVLKSSKLYPNR